MKFILSLVVLFSFNAFAQVKTIELDLNEAIQFRCDEGKKVDFDGVSEFKCVCPYGMYSKLEGNKLKCESLCEITFQYDVVNLDCKTRKCSRESYAAYDIYRNGDFYHREVFTNRHISQAREEILPRVVEMAKKVCSKVNY